MIDLLFISIAFPPKKDPECLQTAKYFKYLVADKELRTTVITTQQPTLNMPYDPELLPYDSGYYKKFDISIFENRYVNKINHILGNPLNFFPDSKYLFHKKINNNFGLIQQPNFIYSRSYPLSSAFGGYRAKKYYKVPWLLHLSDPWTLSPLVHYNRKDEKRHKYFEKELIESADWVSFTSEETVSSYSRCYPNLKNKFLYFPNVYDLIDIPKGKKNKFGSKLKITFTGGLVGNRGAKPILNALALLDDRIKSNLEINFVGEADRINIELFNSHHEKCVNHIGSVGFETSKRLQGESNVLLLIDNEFDNVDDAMFLPSKLLDYMIAGRVILAITTQGGTTDRVLSKLNGHSLSHNNSEGIAGFLKQAVDNFKSRNEEFFINSVILDEFDAQHNAQRLVEFIKSNSKQK